MIQFFRKIRKNSLTENKFGKYLVYAIGEIVLVVIGILIALQINTWNSEKVERHKEMTILKEIKRNLKVNVDEFSAEITKQDSIVQNIDLIMDHIKNDVPYSESLGIKFSSIGWTEEFNVANSAFETLKTLGFDLISSDALRESIIQLFNIEYVRISDVIEKVSSAEHIQLNTLYLRHIEYDKEGKGVVNDFEKLKKDTEFTNMLSSRRIWKIDIINTYRELIDKSQKLSGMIEREIQSRE